MTFVTRPWLRTIAWAVGLAVLASCRGSAASTTIFDDYAECRDHEQFGNVSLICDAERRIQRTTLRNLDSLLRDLQKIPCECKNGCARGAGRSDKYLGLLVVTITAKVNASAAGVEENTMTTLNATARRIYEDARLGDEYCDNGLLILYIKDQQKLAIYRGQGRFTLLNDDDLKRPYQLARKDTQSREVDGGALQALLSDYDERRRADVSDGSGIPRAESWAPIVGLTLALLVVLLILVILFGFFLARLCCFCRRRNGDRKYKYHVSPAGSPTAGYGTVEPIYIVTPPASEHGYPHHHHHHRHAHNRHSALYAQSLSPSSAIDCTVYSSPYGGPNMPFVTHPPRSRSVTPTSMHRTRVHPRRSTSSTRGSQVINIPSNNSSKRERAVNRRSVLASGSSNASAGIGAFYKPPGYAPGGGSGGEWPRRPSSHSVHAAINATTGAPSDTSDCGVGEPSLLFLDPNRKREPERMLKPLARLLRGEALKCAKCCGCSTATRPSIQLPDAVIPSEALIATLDRRTKSLLAKRLVEVEYLYAISTEVPKTLTLSHWLDLCDIASARERESFLRSIYFTELGRERTDQGNVEILCAYHERLADDSRRHDAGEMVYASGFHSLFGALVGADFRAIVDRRYGSRFWEAYRLGEPPLKLIVDCRNLHLITTTNVNRAMRQIQALYDRNWSSARPFEIVIANFLVDNTTARAIRKHWYFLFGPPSYEDNQQRSVPLECADDVIESLEAARSSIDQLGDKPRTVGGELSVESGAIRVLTPYQPLPFIPTITNRSVPDVLSADGIRTEETIYVSPWSRAFLDDRMPVADRSGQSNGKEGHPAIRAIVLPAMDNTGQPWHNSLTAAISDGLSAYRLPIEKYIIVRDGANKSLPLPKIFDILYGVLNAGQSWESMITRQAASMAVQRPLSETAHGTGEEPTKVRPVVKELQPGEIFSNVGKSIELQTKEEREATRLANAAVRRRRVKLLEEMAAAMERRHIALPLSPAIANVAEPTDVGEERQHKKRQRVHRYTREERNERRRREQNI